MKTRRLLALVLCFVMLFSDATSTLASTNPGEPIVITDSSELLNSEVIDTEEPETDVTSTEETGEEAVSTETTEVVVPAEEPERATEAADTIEVVETTEVAEDMEEIITEEVENIKAATTAIMVGYSEGENWVDIGTTPYTSIADAINAIEAHIAANPGFNYNVDMFMQQDAELTGDLKLSTPDVKLGLALNGYTLTVTRDATICADVSTSLELAPGVVDVAAGATLSIMSFDPCGTGSSYDEPWEDGAEYVNWQNVEINFDSTNPGDLIVGQTHHNGEVTNTHIRLNDVLIHNAKNVTFAGNVGYDCMNMDPATVQLNVADTITVMNQNDDERGIWQNAELLVKTTCNNMVWNAQGSVNHLTVNNKLSTSGRASLKALTFLSVNDIEVSAGPETYDTFALRNGYLYDLDGTYLSKANIEIHGTITKDPAMEYAINFAKVRDVLQNDGWRWDEGEIPFENGEVLAMAPNADAKLSRINSQNNDVLFVAKNDNGEFVAQEVMVQVWVWDDMNGHMVKEVNYGSFEAAVTGLYTDFAGVEGRYNFTLYDDITLTEDVVFPDHVQHLCINAPRFDEPIFDANDMWIGDRSWIICPTVDFNGHSITVNGEVEWPEVIQIKNSSENESEIYIKAEANPGPEGYWPSFRGNWFDNDIELLDTDGNKFSFGSEYTFIDNVTIRVPNGRVEFDTVFGGTHVVNGELIVSSFKIFDGKWKVADVTIVGDTDGSFIGEGAETVITGKTTWLSGAGIEVRGTLTFGDLKITANENNAYSKMWLETVEMFDRDAEGTDDYFIGKGKVTFGGTIETAESLEGGSAIQLGKKQVYYYQARDEFGNPLFNDPDGNDPMIWEDQYWDIPFESGETAAYVTESSIEADLFGTNTNGISFEITGQDLKAYKSSVYVELYIEEEDRVIGLGYKTLDEAFANLERDFEGKAGNYTFNILEDSKLSKDIILPDYVRNLRLQSEWIWYEHYDENGNPIEIYDEEGNFMGTEGHHDVYEATLDLNGHSISLAGHIEVYEGLHVISDTEVKGELISTSEDGGVAIRQIDNGGLVEESGMPIEVSMDKPFVILDNVDIVVEKAWVDLWALGGAYTVNGDITSRFLNVKGTWTVEDVKVTTELYIESGWYDEENDYGEPDGYLTADNVSIYNGHMNNRGRLVVKDTFTAKNSGIENFGTLIADKLLVPSGEFHNYEQVSVKDAEIEWFYNHTDVMYFDDDPETPDENEEHVEEWGSIFICDTFKQSAKGYSYMDGSSEFIVNVDAVINNLCTGGFNQEAWNPVNITRMEGATLAINEDIYQNDDRNIPVCIGIFNKSNDNVAGMGIVEVFDKDSETGEIYGSWFELAFVDANGEKAHEFGENGWYGYKRKLERDEVLFTTDIKNVRLELVGISQYAEEGKEEEAIWETSQEGNKVVAGGYTIFVYSMADGNWQWLRDFKVWSDAIAYIDSLANPNIGYVIELTEDINLDGPLTLPKNALEVVIRGLGEKQIEVTCTGDISLSSATVMTNIKLNASNSTMKLNGFNFIFDEGAIAYIGAAVGTKESILAAFNNSAIMIGKAATGLAGLEVMWGSRIELGMNNTADASVAKKLQLYSSTLVIHDSLTVEEVASWDDLNTVVVKDENSFTITGTVYGPDVTWDDSCRAYVGDIGVAEDGSIVDKDSSLANAKIRISAMNIANFEPNSNFAEGEVLVTAPNVSEAWFVTGSVYEERMLEDASGASIVVRTKVGSLTHKDGDAICYGKGDTTPKPVELRINDAAVGDFIPYDTYVTLAEAFAAIDRIGDKEGFYRIVLHDDVEIATMTTPSKAQVIQIWVESEEPKTITYSGDMKLNCRLVIANAILAPKTDSKILVGDYAINLLYGTKLAEGCKITGITGSGVAKGSEVNFHDNEITISGDIKNIGVLCLQNSVLKVEGTVNVGDVISFEDDGIPAERRLQSTLIGTAKVTRKDGKVTKVEPQITFAGDTWYEQSTVCVALQEKQADGSYKLLDFTAAEMADVLAAGIPLVKAPKISSMMLLASKENKAGSYITAKDNGYVVVRKDASAVGVILTFEYPFVRMEWNDEIGDYDYFDDVKIIETYCETVADAVTEINNMNMARPYEIILLPQNAAMAPVSLKMPNAKALESLTIKAQTGMADLRYTGNITFTSDVVVENVNFVQVAKTGVAYVETDTPATVSVSTGGKELTLNGKVTFNTPIKLDGKKTGTLNINGKLTTITYYDQYGICGSITNFAEVNIRNTNENPDENHNQIVLGDYGKETPVFSATVLNMEDDTDLIFYTSDMDAKLNVTDLTVSNGLLYVEGTVTIKNLDMDGETELDAFRKMTLTNVTLNGTPTIRGYREFTISGTVTSNTGNAILHSAQKSASKRNPYLDIKGEVILRNNACKIGVVVDDYMDVDLPKLENSPNATGMLLTAKKASPDMFVPATVRIGNKLQNNIDNAKPYSEDKENGYVLMKSGNSIYVYYGREISVKLIDGTGEELGYYRSITDAVKAIDTIKDKEASYRIELLKGYGDTTDTAAELKLPKYASELMVVSDYKMYFTGKTALSASTALVVASEAEFAGDVTGKGTLALGSNMTVTVKGKVDTTNLVLNGSSILDAKSVVTIGTILNNGNSQNKISYGKDAKNVTYLTIKGLVDGSNANPVLLQLNSNTDKAAYVLRDVNGQVILEKTQKIATIEKAALSSFEVMINEETFYAPEGEPKFTRQIVKANKGVYHVDIDTDADWNGTWLEYTKDGKTYVTCCLDFAQAVNEINTLKDKETDYIINICRRNSTIEDVNLTDKKRVSPITMPKANVANSVTIAYSGAFDWQRGMEFTGNISYAGNLGFVNCEIEAAKISKVKTLTLDNTAFVTTDAVSVGNVIIKGNTTWDAFGKTTVGDLDATEKSVGSYLASKPDKKGVPTFTVNGDVPAETFWKVLKANATTETAAENRYEETYKDRSLVVAKTAGADRFTAYPFGNGGNMEGITNCVHFKDAKNAVKNGNGDDMKVLLSYGGGVTYTKSFDEAVKLIDSIGNKNGRYDIQFLTGGDVTTTGVADSYGKLTLPKKAAWVTISGHLADNNKPDTTLKYTGTMKTSVGLIFENIILTEGTVKANVFTPNYAVTPVTSGKNTEINFMNTVSTMKSENAQNVQTADLAFASVSGNGIIVIHGGNVDVAGGVASDKFIMNNAGNISVGKDVKVTEMVLADNAMLEAKGKFTAKTLRVLDRVTNEELSAVIDADGVIAITDIYGEDYADGLRIITNLTAKNESQLTINGQIAGAWVDVAMNVLDSATGAYREMTMADAKALLVTEENAVPAKTQKIATAPKASSDMYVVTYEQVDEAGNKDWVYFGALPNENPDEEPAWITTYKHEGGMYITNLPTLLSVYGYSEESDYHAQFMNWEQAVKEIDKIGNKDAFYDICLERSVGQNLDGTLNPIKNLTLPAKTAGVGVSGGNIYFTGTKITPKALTEFYYVGLCAVKAVKEDGMTTYESVVYDVNIGNNMVAFGNLEAWANGYECKLGTISGSKKGYLAFYRDVESYANETVATMIKGVGTVEFINWNQDSEEPWINYLVTKGITGVQNLILQPYTFLGAYEGDISVKNVFADNADMYAKNITVSGTVEMSNTGLSAGTETVGDGAIKLKDVVLNGKSGIYGKQDKNGKSLIQITGKVSTGAEYEGDTERLLQVGLNYNNDSGWVPLSNKLVLLTAPKVDAFWFEPSYSWEEFEQAVDEETGELLWDEDGNPIFVQERDEQTGELLFDEDGNPIYVVSSVRERMGWERDDYGTYKNGKVIYYGKLAE